MIDAVATDQPGSASDTGAGPAGRIVREAIAVVIADLEAKGEDSILVRRLRGV